MVLFYKEWHVYEYGGGDASGAGMNGHRVIPLSRAFVRSARVHIGTAQEDFDRTFVVKIEPIRQPLWVYL